MPITVETACTHCGRPFRRIPSRVRADAPRYCSEACATAHRTRSAEQRFWDGVNKSDDPAGCWEWTGARRDTRHYGSICTDDGRMVSVGQFSYELHCGPLPEGHKVGHTCGNLGCVRPDHLFAGTAKDIRQNAKRLGRLPGGIGQRTHEHPELLPRGEEHHNAKLTWRKVRRMRARYAAGEAIRDLAGAYGVDPSAVWQVVHNRTWKEPPPAQGDNGAVHEGPTWSRKQ